MPITNSFPPSFASDNHAGVHPEVLRAMSEANVGFAPAYGADAWTAKAKALFKTHFGSKAEMVPVFNGTGANVVALSSVLKRYEAVICAEKAHIDADEGGAPERLGGMKLLTCPTPDQKLTVEMIRAKLARRGDVHAVQPRIVSITQSTELGTVYSLSELRALGTFLKSEGLVFHMDGSRVANAVITLSRAEGRELSFNECVTDVGVDLLSFGGTKNGLLGVEAVVDVQGAFTDDLRFVQKQSMQLASKMRFFSAQLIALLEGDLWRRNAASANAMATLLASEVSKISGVSITQPVEANAVFATLPRARIEAAQREFPFYIWDETRSAENPEARWMCSFMTKEADVRAFVARLAAPDSHT